MSIIGGGGGANYFTRINQDLAAHGPDAAATESARNASGGKAEQAKFSKADEPHNKHVGRDAVHISTKAMVPVMDDKEAAELADQLGLGQELRTDEDGQVEARADYNRERNLGLDKNDGKQRVVGANGAEQFLDDKEAERLQVVDDEEHPFQLNHDVPQAALEAAGRIVHSQTQKSIKKVAELKHVPEAQEAGAIEAAIVGFESEPMDIMDASDSRFTPMQEELPDSTHQMAAEMAAQQLANGEVGEQIITS